MKLTAYMSDGHRLNLRPAPLERAWMNATDERFAYRCLPLNIANAHGWEILCPSGFVAAWNGGRGKEAIEIFADEGTTAPAVSHFAHGVLTFHVPCLFQTEPGFDLMVQGPINRPKDSIAPLSATPSAATAASATPSATAAATSATTASTAASTGLRQLTSLPARSRRKPTPAKPAGGGIPCRIFRR
jgi:hypothetical protein